MWPNTSLKRSANGMPHWTASAEVVARLARTFRGTEQAMQPTTLHEYQSSWPTLFSEVSAELALTFAGMPVHIEHIGSTSVPGLCAKPVLDIMLGVQALASVESRIADLEMLGYTYRPEYEVAIPRRRYFVRPEGKQLRIHLHAVEHESEIWLKHLAFRDALRTNPGLAAEYATLKKALAVEHRDNKSAYTEAKAPFITGVLIKLIAHTDPEGGTHGNV